MEKNWQAYDFWSGETFLVGYIPWFTEKAFVFWYFNGDIPPKKLEYYENTEVPLIIGFSHMYLNDKDAVHDCVNKCQSGKNMIRYGFPQGSVLI